MRREDIRLEGSEDWLQRWIDVLRPGWRGRLHVRTPELAEHGKTTQIVGTIVGEPSVERDSDDEGVADAHVTFCANYRNGRFGPTLGEPYIDINLSWIVEAEAM